MSGYTDLCKGCRLQGWEDEGGGEGWPICRYPEVHPTDTSDEAVPCVCVVACPVGRWRTVNGVRVPCDQTTLGAY